MYKPDLRGEVSDFDRAIEDIPTLKPSIVFAIWIWTMRIGGITLIILGFLLLFNVADANAKWGQTQEADRPAAVFHQSGSTIHFKVFRFYDAKFQVLCYAGRASMQCIPLGKLTPTARQRIEKMVEGAMNHMQIPPENIFKIP